jgi:hypothetical protein
MSIGNDIKRIDQEFDVSQMTVNGISFWPFVKIFVFDQLFVAGGTKKEFGLWSKLKFVFSLFYGFVKWFGKADFLVFSNSDQRKLFNEKWVDKSADYLHPHLENSLHIELPVVSHYAHKHLPYQRVVSHLPLRVLEQILGKFIRPKVMGNEVIQAIQKDLDVDINYHGLAIRFYAQYVVAKWLVKLYTPKKVFMAVPYMKMGYVYAFQSAGIPVIEMQHGTINTSHFGYCNYANLDSKLFPESLLAYGDEVQRVFEEGNETFQREHIFPIGHYYLSLIQSQTKSVVSQNPETFEGEVNIAVSLQDDAVGKKLVPFLAAVAQEKPRWNFVFSPRKTTEEEYRKMSLPSNIVFNTKLNVYQIIGACQVHTTAFSTCALEAPSLGVPNVLCNIENKAKEYFGNALDHRPTYYCDSVAQYIGNVEDALHKDASEIMEANQHIIRPHFKRNLNQALANIFSV